MAPIAGTSQLDIVSTKVTKVHYKISNESKNSLKTLRFLSKHCNSPFPHGLFFSFALQSDPM